MNWPDSIPARSLSLVVGKVVGGDLAIKESLVSLLLHRAQGLLLLLCRPQPTTQMLLL